MSTNSSLWLSLLVLLSLVLLSSIGSNAQNSCSPGTYYNSTDCVPCPVGTYAPSSGLTGCYQCSFGTYSATTGAAACSWCSAGTFNAAIGATTCTACPVGTYSNSVRPTSCQDCSVMGKGYYNTQTGQSTCKHCGRVEHCETYLNGNFCRCYTDSHTCVIAKAYTAYYEPTNCGQALNNAQCKLCCEPGSPAGDPYAEYYYQHPSSCGF